MPLRIERVDRTLLDREWSGEFVVYDPYSGNTHHLTELAGVIYGLFCKTSSLDFDELFSMLAPALADRAGDPGEEVASALADLRQRGLITATEA